MSATPIDEIDRLLVDAVDADDVLRGTVAALVSDPRIVWAGIGFVEGDAVLLGPTAGAQDEARRVRVPITFQGTPIGELWVDGVADPALLDGVAARIAPQVLIGWDTGGEAWEP